MPIPGQTRQLALVSEHFGKLLPVGPLRRHRIRTVVFVVFFVEIRRFDGRSMLPTHRAVAPAKFAPFHGLLFSAPRDVDSPRLNHWAAVSSCTFVNESCSDDCFVLPTHRFGSPAKITSFLGPLFSAARDVGSPLLRRARARLRGIRVGRRPVRAPARRPRAPSRALQIEIYEAPIPTHLLL